MKQMKRSKKQCKTKKQQRTKMSMKCQLRYKAGAEENFLSGERDEKKCEEKEYDCKWLTISANQGCCVSDKDEFDSPCIEKNRYKKTNAVPENMNTCKCPCKAEETEDVETLKKKTDAAHGDRQCQWEQNTKTGKVKKLVAGTEFRQVCDKCADCKYDDDKGCCMPKSDEDIGAYTWEEMSSKCQNEINLFRCAGIERKTRINSVDKDGYHTKEVSWD
mmetsp:Transcript_76115/g.236396  ORF Transcript_76115/g.236396 Transcript_76115/m.236396 type:complete len:218 (-) Transcript_76115:27-680(-)